MALLPPFYLDAVVALEAATGDDFSTVATGVIVGFDTQQLDEDGERLYNLLLITNEHVLEGQSELFARFSKGTGPDRYKIGLLDGDSTPRWKSHDRFDVAALRIDLRSVRDAGTQQTFVAEGEHTFSLREMEESGVSVGDSIFVLGFPMGLSGAEKKRTIVRSGCIARLDNEVIDEVGGFLVDATIFPGNSGGPVFNVPSQVAVEGTTAVNKCSMLGIVSSYIPYEDVAISQQTGKARIIFQENSRLASVVPFDAIKEVAESLLIAPEIPGAGEEVLPESQASGENGDADPPLDASLNPSRP